jgi:hypothetical protein
MLDSLAVDRLFARLLIAYGSGWTAKWAGIPVDTLKASWAHTLDGISYESIAYGLDHLPEFVPTAHQFREITRHTPLPEYTALPAPKPTQEEKDRVRGMLADVRRKLTTRGIA